MLINCPIVVKIIYHQTIFLQVLEIKNISTVASSEISRNSLLWLRLSSCLAFSSMAFSLLAKRLAAFALENKNVVYYFKEIYFQGIFTMIHFI